ncbi:MAG TPA: hypothetical protein VFX49_06335, partial [Chloroflexota bacterium]|nr:hypothetical protein [Chloroflexota bacterium]
RFGPLAPLAIGLYFRFGGPTAIITPLVVAHVILAFASVAFVEVAAARQRRGMDPAGPSPQPSPRGRGG